MALKEIVIALRNKKGMNQKQLAEAADITQATISRIEKGQVKQLKSEALKKLAKALGVTVDYLIGNTEKLSQDDILKSDSTAQNIFRGYEKLSYDSQKELERFVNWLESKEKKEHTTDGSGWQPIETAPKDGTEILGWRDDCGMMLIRYTSLEEFLSTQEIEELDCDDDTIFKNDWFYADFVQGGRLEGDEVPTHWFLPRLPEA